MSEKSEHDKLPEGEELVAALQDVAPELDLEEFMDLSRSCMLDETTPVAAKQYLMGLAAGLADKSAKSGQHLAAIMILAGSGAGKAVVLKYVKLAFRAHPDNDPVRALIKRELRTFSV